MQLVHILLVIIICLFERLALVFGCSNGLIMGGNISHPYCGYNDGKLISTKTLDDRRYIDYATYYPMDDVDIKPGMTLKSSKPGLFKMHIAKNTHMSRFDLPINTMSWAGGFIMLAINNMKYNIEHAITSLEDPNVRLPILQIHINPYYIKKRLDKDPTIKLSLGLRVRCKFNRNLLFFSISPNLLDKVYETDIKPMIENVDSITNTEVMNDIIDYAKWYLFYKPSVIKNFLYHPNKYTVTPLTIRLGDDELYSSYRYDGKQKKWITSELDAKDHGRPKTDEELRILKQRGSEYEAYQQSIKESGAKLYEDLPTRLRPCT
jgi:hypothetical protein